MILHDSGVRRQFASGAVRDIAEGKGRCDLLPLAEVAAFVPDRYGGILEGIDCFVRTADPGYLRGAVRQFIALRYQSDIFLAMLEVAKQYEDGAKKYEDRNWEAGMPLHCFIDSGVRHLLKWARGQEDEPHDRAFLWNMLGALWTLQNKPELNDLPHRLSDEIHDAVLEAMNEDVDTCWNAEDVTKEGERTEEDLKDMITSLGYEDVLIFSNPDYASAFLGISECNRAVYDKDLMVEHLMRVEGMEEGEALEFIDYNTVRSLPYFDKAPVVLNRLRAEDF